MEAIKKGIHDSWVVKSDTESVTTTDKAVRQVTGMQLLAFFCSSLSIFVVTGVVVNIMLSVLQEPWF